ncbi:unnamed protein product, partial [Adineta ricciae]
MDTVVQMARCSFDIHVQEILGTLMIGATLVMLHPGGTIDFYYLADVLASKNISYIHTVPSLLHNFFVFIENDSNRHALQYLRSICSIGEVFSTKLQAQLSSVNSLNCKVWNMYGPAETTIASTFYQVNVTDLSEYIPIGASLPKYRCVVLDEYLQRSILNQAGELCIGGVGVFPGYLRGDDLNIKALISIDDQLLYKTGDLARVDNNGLLVYIGRKDFQIKLHGQRIELTEIEKCLLRKTSVSACIVIKWGDNHLVAYIQASNIDEEQLREHCQAHLSPHMIPSMFIILNKLPLNPNGKIDRKSLPAPKFELHSADKTSDLYVKPKDESEIYIHKLWSKILNTDKISTNASFFDIGGHSLLLVQLYQSYRLSLDINTTKISIADLRQYPTITDHARLIAQEIRGTPMRNKLGSEASLLQETMLGQKLDSSSSTEDNRILSDELARHEPFPVTDIQQAYLIGREGFIELGSVSCFVYHEYDFPATFDIEKFEKALNYLIQYHEALRTIFISRTEQKILETVPLYTLSIVELDDTLTMKEKLLERRRELSHRILPADQWPLFNIQTTHFKLDNEYRTRLHIGFDALILDFWSMMLIYRQLGQLYSSSNFALPKLTFSFRDYVLSEEKFKSTPNYTNDKGYWLDRLNTFPSGPKLPLQCLPNEIHVQRHCNSQQLLDRSSWSRLKRRIIDYELTPAGFLVSIYAIVLSKWSENKHFALNLPIFNRLPIHPQINEIAGDFTTVLPLEIHLDEPISYYKFVQTVQRQLWNDLEHMSYNGVSFVRDLMQTQKTKEIVLPFVFTCGIDIGGMNQKDDSKYLFLDQRPEYMISQTPQVFLDHVVYESDGHLSDNWIYVNELLSSELIENMHMTFINALHEFSLSDDMWQQPISISLPPDQYNRRLHFNQTQWKPNIKQHLLHSGIIEKAEQTPDSLAIISPQAHFTYKQLMDRVYSLASHLEHEYQIRSNELIAILMKKGWEQVVACLAILVSGGAYLPLDVDAPYDRLKSLIEETSVRIVLTQSHCQHVFSHLTTIAVDTFTTTDWQKSSFLVRQQSPTDLAYIIYTSGSTGKPKGVMISHQAALNTILDMNSRLEITSHDRIFALSHLNFDLSVYDIFGSLNGGGTIVIPGHEDYKNPKHWCDMMIEYRVTIWNSVPMLMQMLVEHYKHTKSNHHQLRHVLLSGDWIPLTLPKAIHTTFGTKVMVISLGGATEASIWSIAYEIPRMMPQEWKSIPYGAPLRNQHYYVYDSHLDDCPEWVMGELYIGGIGLADGYWNDAVKTQSSFMIHPRTRERIYRTGDHGRFMPGGYIEFMGRKDYQVKVHGHRIELGEIEYHLQQHSDIHQAVASVDLRSQQLIAYIMPERHSLPSEKYDPSQIEITGHVERSNFKLARYGIQHQLRGEKSVALTKPKLTETLINKYYARKSYRQFTNEHIDRSTIETLLKQCYNMGHDNEKSFSSHISFDTLSTLLAILTPINFSNQPLPKYYYASAGSLYPVQVYVEVHTPIDGIPPGLYYHNPDKHSLELVSASTNEETASVYFHLVGRSSAIAPLYSKTLGTNFCSLETGYMMGLLEKEASKMGLKFFRDYQIESLTKGALNVNEGDTHYCFEVFSNPERMTNDKHCQLRQCLVYIKSSTTNESQWFKYVSETDHFIHVLSGTGSTEEEMPLFFDNDNDAKAIFHDCQFALFFIGNPNDNLEAGKISHLLMEYSVEKNIGICPIGSRASFPAGFNNILDSLLTSDYENNNEILLHILLAGKISDEQKYDRTISRVKAMPKWNETLKAFLSAKLPTYMIPSHFLPVSTFPLNPNGKIDRQALPEISVEIIRREDAFLAPQTETERIIVNIWQQVLYTDKFNSQHGDLQLHHSDMSLIEEKKQSAPPISVTSSFYGLGGDSLLLIQIYRQYQLTFNFESDIISIRPFFENDTIADHAKLLVALTVDNIKLNLWHTLHIAEGIASFAQERIYLDEQVRFSNKIAIYNEIAALQVANGSLSVDRLSRALQSVMSKHKILRTSLTVDYSDRTLTQQVNNGHAVCKLLPDKTFINANELHDIIWQITIDPNLFSLSTGSVFHCQILRQHRSSEQMTDPAYITEGDVLIIGAHHAAADRSTFPIIYTDICSAYNNHAGYIDDKELLQYIDYSVHERITDMTTSRQFWASHLQGSDLERRLPLPIDHHRSHSAQRSGYASIFRISFHETTISNFLNCASSYQVTPFQLGLTTFYAFLYRLTRQQTDLCVACLNANRYRSELENMVGMFVSTLPYLIHIDSDTSFDDLFNRVRNECLSIFEHSQYPLQYIIKDFNLNSSNLSFLETLFDYITVSFNAEKLFMDTANMKQVASAQSLEVGKFDFKLTFIQNPALADDKLSVKVVCSDDVFDDSTISKMAYRFKYLFEQFFSMDSTITQTKLRTLKLNDLILVLPEEVNEIQNALFRRQSISGAQGPASYAQARIWLDERTRFDPDKPQLAIYNMPFLYRLATGSSLSVQQLR